MYQRKTPSSEEAGTDVEMVKEIQMRKSTLTVSSPDGTTRLEIVSYSFPHEPGEGGEGEGGEGEGGEE